jgi:hypothetical protein
LFCALFHARVCLQLPNMHTHHALHKHACASHPLTHTQDGEPDFPPFLDVGELIPDFLLEEDLFQQNKGSA